MISPLLAVLTLASAASSAQESLRDWRFFETADDVYAVRSDEYGEAVSDPAFKQDHARDRQAAYKGIRVYSFKLAADEPDRPLSASARWVGTLKIYHPPQPGLRPHAVCLGDSQCLNGQEISAAPCEAPECRHLRIDRPQSKRGGTRLTEADFDRPLTMPGGMPARAPRLQTAEMVSKAQEMAGHLGATRRSGEALAENPTAKAEASQTLSFPRDIPREAANTLAQVRAIQRSQARHPGAVEPGDQYVVVDAKGNVVALSQDAETARRVAGEGHSVYRAPKAVPTQAKSKAATPPPPTVSSGEIHKLIRKIQQETLAARNEIANAESALSVARSKFLVAQRGDRAKPGSQESLARTDAAKIKAEARLKKAREASASLAARRKAAYDELRRALDRESAAAK